MLAFAKKLTWAAVISVIAIPMLSAQTTYDQRHSINDRRGDEQSRIKQGEASGQITEKGANNLASHQQAIHNQARTDRASDGGHLTAQDRHQLARKQNQQSARIYRDKHNAATQPGVAPR